MNTSSRNTRPLRPSLRFRLTMAAAVAVVGLTASIVWAAVGIWDQTQRPVDMVTAATPGSVTVQITRAGPHVVYLESTVPADVRELDEDFSLSASDIAVTGPDGHSVTTTEYTRDLRYDAPRGASGTLGQAFAMFEAPQAGEYVVATDATLADPTARIAVGDDLAPGVLRAVFLPVLTGVFSLVAAIVLAVRALMTASQQHRSTTNERGVR